MQLESLGFTKPIEGSDPFALGVLRSRNASVEPQRFLVPAHALCTINIVEHGELQSEEFGCLHTFITGPQTKRRLYTLSRGATLTTAFLRTDFLRWIPKVSPASFVDKARPTDTIIPWAATSDPLALLNVLHRFGQVASKDEHNFKNASASLGRLFRAIANTPGLTLVALAKQQGLSPRTIQRVFHDNWGVPVTFVRRLLRVNAAVAQWPKFRQIHGESLSAFAQDLGFQDQAHLAGEFRALVGAPPKTLKLADEAQDILWALRLGQNQLVSELLASFSKTSKASSLNMHK